MRNIRPTPNNQFFVVDWCLTQDAIQGEITALPASAPPFNYNPVSSLNVFPRDGVVHSSARIQGKFNAIHHALA